MIKDQQPKRQLQPLANSESNMTTEQPAAETYKQPNRQGPSSAKNLITANRAAHACEDLKRAPTRKLTMRSCDDSSVPASKKLMAQSVRSCSNSAPTSDCRNDDFGSGDSLDSFEVRSETSSSLELKAPWSYFRGYICDELAKWCTMCDNA